MAEIIILELVLLVLESPKSKLNPKIIITWSLAIT